MVINALGRHLLVEFYNCNSKIINDESLVEQYMNEAALKAQATIVKSTFHTFAPQGISGVVVIAESHLAIHTWPENGYVAVDLFTCGESVNPWVAFEYLKDKFEATKHETQEMIRGDLSKITKESNLKCFRSDNGI
jgi:S-adenosylmethionine decarboxylase